MPKNWQLATLASVSALLILQVIQNSIDYQFKRFKNQSNFSLEPSSYNLKTMAIVTSWLYTCRYLLPVLGGLLACWVGHVRVLQLGGCAMLITTLLMSVAIYLDSWSGIFALATCLLMLVLNGLIVPNVMQGILSKRTQPRYRTVLCALIYASTATGHYAGINFSTLKQLLPAHTYAIVYLAAAVLYCVIALPLSLPCAKAAVAHDAYRGAEEDAALSRWRSAACNQRIELPTQNRLKRSCLVFGAFIPYLIGVSDDSAAIFEAHSDWHVILNSSSESWNPKALQPISLSESLVSTILSGGIVAFNICLVAAACLFRRSAYGWRLPMLPRLVLGICISIVLEITLAVVSSGAVNLNDQIALDAIFIAANMAESVSAVLVMVAAYEVMDGFERDAARPLIVGVMLTVWGFASVLERLMTNACLDYLPPQLRFVYHLILTGLLLISLLYTWFLALPLAKSLTVTYRWESEDEERLLGNVGYTESLPPGPASLQD